MRGKEPNDLGAGSYFPISTILLDIQGTALYIPYQYWVSAVLNPTGLNHHNNTMVPAITQLMSSLRVCTMQ